MDFNGTIFLRISIFFKSWSGSKYDGTWRDLSRTIFNNWSCSHLLLSTMRKRLPVASLRSGIQFEKSATTKSREVANKTFFKQEKTERENARRVIYQRLQ